MTNLQRTILLISMLLVLVVVRLSCDGDSSGRPPLGYVTGKVTLNGKPLAGVVIAFYPVSGRMGTAYVDENGKYEVKYTNRVRGTKIGPSTVHFSWSTGQSGPSIPEKYGEKSELKVEVKKGKNVFDFALESSSSDKPAIPPQAGVPVVD